MKEVVRMTICSNENISCLEQFEIVVLVYKAIIHVKLAFECIENIHKNLKKNTNKSYPHYTTDKKNTKLSNVKCIRKLSAEDAKKKR